MIARCKRLGKYFKITGRLKHVSQEVAATVMSEHLKDIEFLFQIIQFEQFCSDANGRTFSETLFHF